MRLIKRFWLWISSFFKPQSSEHRPVKKRKPRVKRENTLSDLLDNLDYAFEEIKVDYHNFSAISKSEVDGLKRYGVSIIPGIEKLFDEDIVKPKIARIENPKSLSSIIFIATNCHKWEPIEGFASPDFFYALKMKKPPWFVARKRGIYYNCAFGYKMQNKQWWTNFFITISPQGEILPMHQLWYQDVQTSKHDAYCRKMWSLSKWNSDDQRITENVIKGTALHFLNAWIGRTKMWSTTVEKDGVRANFYVDTRDTKYYFRGREKSFTENGATKKIIHFVDEHERVIDGKKVVVKPHIRGEDKFHWKGYNCRVISPTYHGFAHSQFDLESEQEITVTKENQNKYMSIGELANYLHKLEDQKTHSARRTLN